MNRYQIEKNLIGNGHLIAEAKRRGQSLDRANRAIIGRVRQQAIDAGISRDTWNYLEMEGERGARGVVGSEVVAVFIGEQSVKGLSLFIDHCRLYNIEGDHRLNHSTVGMITLVHEWILPRDLTMKQIASEYLREVAFLVESQIMNIKSSVAQFFKGGR